MMETPSRNRSPAFHRRSFSPSGRFCSSSTAFAAPPAARSDRFLPRSTSPTRVSLSRPVSPSAVRFSPSMSHAAASRQHQRPVKKTCMCSPTSHPGSFRCSLHKNSAVPGYTNQAPAPSYRSSHQLNMRRSAMTNSLVRIGTVEGDLVRRALTALIRPSSHSVRRRFDFQPRPSRLSVMSKADDVL